MNHPRIPVANPSLGDQEAQAAYDVVKSGWLSMGENVRRFEDAFASVVGARHAVAMANGTVTLHALLAALNIGPGDEVIVPSLTYISTANSVLYVGATLVLCDCEPGTLNVTAEIIEERITPRTKAIIVVDMSGLPADYGAITETAARHGIPVIGDSAESLGAALRRRVVGGQALAHSFSFFANKNVTTGEGGMVTTDDERLAEKLRILRNQGQEGRYWHTHLGYNYRMTDLAAAIGLVQLGRLEQSIAAKQRIANLYEERFASDTLITPPRIPEYVTRHAWYLYTLILDPAVDRDAVVTDLEREGIETRTSFRPVHLQPYYVGRFGYAPGDFPVSFDQWSRLLNIPIWAGLSESQVERVATATIQAVRSRVLVERSS